MYAFITASVVLFYFIMVPQTWAETADWNLVKLTKKQQRILSKTIAKECSNLITNTTPEKCAAKQQRDYKKRIWRKNNGLGRRVRKDGSLFYVGNLKNGKFYGQGELYHVDGKTIKYSGIFAENFFNGYGQYFGKKGNLVYEGFFKNNKFFGQGKKYYTNGNVAYEGEFKANKFDGIGRYFSYHKNKIYYILSGDYSKGKIIGNFTLNGPGKTVGTCTPFQCTATLSLDGKQTEMTFSNKTFALMKLEQSRIRIDLKRKRGENRRLRKKQLIAATKQMEKQVFNHILKWLDTYK